MFLSLGFVFFARVVLHRLPHFAVNGPENSIDEARCRVTPKGLPEFDKAASDYSAYLALKPGDGRALYRRGLCRYRKAGDSAKPESMNKTELKAAIADLDAAGKAATPDPETFYYLGLASDNLGMADDSGRVAAFKQAIDAYKKYIASPGVKPEDARPVKDRITQLQEEIG